MQENDVRAEVVERLSKRKQLLNDALRMIVVILSAVLYSLAVSWFLEPANLLSIGLTAVGQIFNRLFSLINVNIPIGVFTLVLNIPLCIIGIKYVSPRFIIFTIVSVVVQSIMLLGWVPAVDFGIDSEKERLFLSIIAGLLCGAGIGTALRYGTSTGGVDIIAQALSLKKGISIGVVSMIVNIILAIIAGGIMQGDWAITLYTFIFIIITNLVVDKIHTAYNYLRIDIVTKNKEELTTSLLNGIKRGCSILDVEGAYTKEMKYDVYMVISSYELEKAKRIIYKVDPNAFIIVTPVKKIIGAFFKHTIV